MPKDMTANSDSSDGGDQLDASRTSNGVGPNVSSSGSSRREAHNSIEKKRKDRLKEDIEKLRKLIPDANFVIKKQTHHEVMQTACDYISNLQQQNNEFLLGKKDEVTTSVIEQLRSENAVLKRENKRFRDIVEHAGFPPLADLSKLVLSWKPRSMSENTNLPASTKACVSELTSLQTKAIEQKRKKQGLTVNECLKRVSEIDKDKLSTGDICCERIPEAELIFDTICTTVSSQMLTEVSTKLSITEIASTQSVCNNTIESTELLQTADVHNSVVVCDSGADSVLNLYNGNAEESLPMLLSELIAGPHHAESGKFQIKPTSTNGIVKSDTSPMQHNTLHDSNELVLSCTADRIEQQTECEPIETPSATGESSHCSNIDGNTPWVHTIADETSVAVESIAHCDIKISNSILNNVCVLPDNIVSSTSVDNSPNNNVRVTACSAVPNAVVPAHFSNAISLTSANTVNHLVVRNSAEQMFVNLDIGSSVMGSGLVYGKFIYHNGQLVLSRGKVQGSLSELQYILPNVPQTVFCSPFHSTTFILPAAQVLPVYPVLHQPTILTFCRSDVAEPMDLTPPVEVQNCDTSLDGLLTLNNDSCLPLGQTFETGEATAMSPVISSVSEISNLNANSTESVTKTMVVSVESSASVKLVASGRDDDSTVDERTLSVPSANGERVDSACLTRSSKASRTINSINDAMSADTTISQYTPSCIEPVNSEQSNNNCSPKLSNCEYESAVICAPTETRPTSVNSFTNSLAVVSDVDSKVLSAVVEAKAYYLRNAEDINDKTRPAAETNAVFNVCDIISINSRAETDGVHTTSVSTCIPFQSSSGPTLLSDTICAVCTHSSVSNCWETNSLKSGVQPVSVVISTTPSCASSSNTAVSKYLDMCSWSLPLGSSVSNCSTASFPAPSSSKTSFYESYPSYQTSSMVISSDLHDIHKAYKRKSLMSCSEKAVKSQRMNSGRSYGGPVSRYVCPPPDSALDKERCLDIYVLDQLNSNSRITGIDCVDNGFDEFIPGESPVKNCRDNNTCTMETANSLPSAVPVVDEFWRPDSDFASVMHMSTLRNKSELLSLHIGTSCVDDASYKTNATGIIKPPSVSASKCVTATVSQESSSSVNSEKYDRTTSSTARSKSFTLASFLPVSQASEVRSSGSSTPYNFGIPKSPKISEPAPLFLADCGLSNQNVYSHVPKSSVIFGDSFCNSLQDDLSLTDNDLSVFLNDADVFPMLPVKSVDTSVPFWNAGISNSRSRERGKEMGSQYCRADASVPVMPSFGENYRIEWNTNERTDISNSRSCFDVSSLTGKTSTITHPVSSMSHNVEQQHVSSFSVHQMQNSLYAPFDSFSIPTSLPCYVPDQNIARTTANACAISERTVSSSKEIFSLARQVVSPTGNHSSTVSSSASRISCTAPVNSLWSPCASRSYSGSANKISSHSPPLYDKKDHTLSGVWSGREYSNSAAVTKQSLLGLQLPSNSHNFDTSDIVASSCYTNNNHQGAVQVATSQRESDNAIQSSTVSLSFRPQLELGISKPHCKWSEEEIDPFPTARKKPTSSAISGRQYAPTVSTVHQVDHLVKSTQTNMNMSSSTTHQDKSSSGANLALPASHLPRRTTVSQASSSSFSFPFALPQPVSAPVSCHKLPSFSFAAVPPIPDFIRFNFTPNVPMPSIPPNQCNRQSSISGSQWNFSASATPHSQNLGQQPLAFGISSQLNGYAEPSSNLAKEFSHVHEHNQSGQKLCAKNDQLSSFLHKTKESGLINSSQPIISSPHIASVQQSEQNYYVNPCAILSPCPTVAKGRTCPNRGSTFTDYCLTSPPLHHPPVLTSSSSDKCSAKLLKGSSSFAIPYLTTMPTFSASHSSQPSSTSASLITVGTADAYSGIYLETGNSTYGLSRSDQEFVFPSYGTMESQQTFKWNGSKRSPKCVKRLAKCAPDTYKIPLPICASQSNVLPQSLTSELPTYLTNAPLASTGFVDSSVYNNSDVNECQMPVSLNPVFGPTIPNSLALNSLAFQQTSAGSALHIPTSHGHLHNFGIGAMFSELTNSTSVIAPPVIRGLQLPSPAASNFMSNSDAVSYQHHYRPVNQQQFTSKAIQSSSMHNMSINSLLGHEQRDLSTSQFNAATSDVANPSSMPQFTAPSFDFPSYSHYR